MNKKLKPDFGIFYKENLSGNSVYLFYNIQIYELSIVGNNQYSFTSFCSFDNQEYAATFDFSFDKFQKIIDSLSNRNLANLLKAQFNKQFTEPFTVSFKDNPIELDIEAILGNPVKSVYEEFIPFSVKEFSNVICKPK